MNVHFQADAWEASTVFRPRIGAMNVRFELEGIALSMPTLKRARRLGSCMGTDEAAPSKGTGSWRADRADLRARGCASALIHH